MTYENLILGISIHMLFYQHLPHWGTWFNRLLKALPRPLQTLYTQWECPYCCAFWIGLTLHAVTGHWFLPGFAGLHPALGWFADAMSFAVMVKLGVVAFYAIGFPALLGRQKMQEFLSEKHEDAG